eukprot:SM000014S00291  [mRNA]  locus=s14:516177:519763:+ [translate_table: standard]
MSATSGQSCVPFLLMLPAQRASGERGPAARAQLLRPPLPSRLPLQLHTLLRFLPTQLPPTAQADRNLQPPLPPFFARAGGAVFVDGEPRYRLPFDRSLVDPASIDIVLVSSAAAMTALPYLVLDPAFKGRVLATIPAVHIARLLMQGLVAVHAEFARLYPYDSLASADPPGWLRAEELAGLPDGLRQEFAGPFEGGGAAVEWRKLYSAEDVERSLQMVHGLHLREEELLSSVLRAVPIGSGAGIGSCNWVLKDSASGRCVSYVASSTAACTPFAPLDLPTLGKGQDLLFSSLAMPAPPAALFRSDAREGMPASTGLDADVATAPTPARELDAQGMTEELRHQATQRRDSQLAAATQAACMAIDRGGCVLLPADPCGVELELIEQLAAQVQTRSIPILHISSIAEEALAYANIVPEWLSPERQEKLYAGLPSFGHAELIREGRLQVFPSLHCAELRRAWKEPCLAIVPYGGLRMGPVMDLLLKWQADSRCLLLLTQEGLDVELALAPLHPLGMDVRHIPIGARLSWDEAAAIVRSTKSTRVLVPASAYTRLGQDLQDAGRTSELLVPYDGTRVGLRSANI